MSLEGIPGMTPEFRNFVYIVREFMRDYPELNRLVRGEESTDRQIAWAVLDAMDDFNGTPPITAYTLATLLQRHQSALLRRLTVCTLMESVGLLQTRNHLNYSDGGMNVGVNDKTPLIHNWLNLFRSSAEQMKQRVKVAMNIESIMGPGNAGVHSELWALNATYIGF
jgi:hypothetical protein